MVGKKRGILIFILILVTVVAGCNGQTEEATNADNSTDSNESIGGELRYALNSQPSTLDSHLTTGSVERQTSRHIFETLVTLNSEYKQVPMLAESVDKSEDGKTYTFHLRKGVKFHNGKEMTAEDVVASMIRWMEKSAMAKETMGDAVFEAKEKYTVVLKLQEPSLGALDVMASPKQFPAIMPKEVVETADSDGVAEYIGTGPFKFMEWKQDQYIHLTKFEEYQPVNGGSDGLSGKKEALVEDLYFDIVTDPSTRQSGLQTGLYDIADGIPHNSYEQLKNDPNLNTFVGTYGNIVHVYNKKQGLFTDVKMRKAVNAALDSDKIMLAAFSDEDLYDINPGYMDKEQKNWYSEAGKEAYNQANPEKAKRLLEEAGYNGEVVRILTTRDSQYLYDSAVVVSEQLEQIGMKVKLEVYDWATYVDRRDNPENWDLLSAGLSIITTPSQHLALSSTWPGWTEDEKVNSLLEKIKMSASQEEAKKQWDTLQGYLWTEYLPVSKYGDYTYIIATTKQVEGFTIFDGPVLWNTKITE